MGWMENVQEMTSSKLCSTKPTNKLNINKVEKSAIYHPQIEYDNFFK